MRLYGRRISNTPRSTAGEHGFTLIEILIAMALVAIGVAATIGVFGSSDRATARAQRSEVGIQQGQAEIDRLSTVKYGRLALTSTPTPSTDVHDPRNRLTGTSYQVRTGLSEPLVLTAAAGETAAVDPGPTNFSVGSGSAAVTGKIFRFVSWRDEQCPLSLCDGTQNTKRISVAVLLNPANSNEQQRPPLWLSTILADPDAVPPGREAPPDDEGPAPASAQSFYLYDTRCGLTARVAPSASHYTHNTASSGPAPADNSICENADTTKQPDLMGTTPPSGGGDTLYDYSADLNGGYLGGTALMRRGTTCRTSYSTADASNPANYSKWNVHAWATNNFASSFNLKGRVTLSFFTSTLGGTTGRGLVCATLIDRQIFSGLPSDRVLGSSTYDVGNWPSDVRRLTFTFNLAGQETVAAGHRLVLAVNVRSESDQDLAIIYDHTTYPSLLEVETTTPLAG